MYNAAVIDFQFEVVDKDVLDEVNDLWANNSYPNDVAYHPWNWDEDPEKYPSIFSYIDSIGLTRYTKVLLHWWW